MISENYDNSKLQENEQLVKIWVSKLGSYWPLFVISVSVFLSAAFIYLRYTTPKYEANAKIVIKDEKKGTDDSKMIESMNIISTKKIIENEIEVLQSRKIINKVVKNLKLYAPITVHGKIRDMSAYNFSPVNVESYDPDSLRESDLIQFTYNQKDSSIHWNNYNKAKLNQWINTQYGQIRFVKNDNKNFERKNKIYYFKIINPEDATDDILRNLKVAAANKLSSIINISYKDEVPQRAKDILNELILMYDKAAIEEKNIMAKNALHFIESRLNIVSKNLDSIERTVQAFKTNNDASDLSTQGQMYLQNVSSNDQELGKINMQLAILDQVYDAISREKLSSIPMMPSMMGVADENLSKLMSDLNIRELEFEKLKKTVAEDNPLLVSLKDQIKKLKPGIIENLESQKKNLQAGKSNLIATNLKYNSVLSTLPQKEKRLLELSRDQAIKNSIYSFLLQKREESELSYASTLSDNRVINDALSSKYPVSPNKLIVYFSALLCSILTVILFIYLKETFSRKILFRNELSSLTSLPIIGEISHKDKYDDKLIVQNKRSIIAEEFRKLRISLQFLGIGDKQKIVQVTSSIPGEGKSFIAANLAISNACAGKKVLLIDADLHKSGLNKLIINNTQKIGLTDFIIGDYSVEEIVNKAEFQENLFILNPGSFHENPSELIVNKKMELLLKQLHDEFDLIIIDTAPAVLITDAFVLSDKCNATIYVVRQHFTPRSILKKVNESLKINPLKNAGILFNGVKKRQYYNYEYANAYNHVFKNQLKYEKRKLINVKI